MIDRKIDYEKIVYVNSQMLDMNGVYVVEWVEQPTDVLVLCREPFQSLTEAIGFHRDLDSKVAQMNWERARMQDMADDDSRWDAQQEGVLDTNVDNADR